MQILPMEKTGKEMESFPQIQDTTDEVATTTGIAKHTMGEGGKVIYLFAARVTPTETNEVNSRGAKVIPLKREPPFSGVLLWMWKFVHQVYIAGINIWQVIIFKLIN